MNVKVAFKVTVKKGDTVSAGPHQHDFLELVYFLKGTGKTTIGKDTYPVRANSFCLIPPHETHSQVSETAITSICLCIGNSGLESSPGVWVDTEGEVRYYLEELMGELSGKRSAYLKITEGLLITTVGLIKRVIKENIPQDRKQAIVSKALYIIESKSGNLSIDDIAGQLFVSKDYLRHLFTQYTGLSPVKAIINARIEHAKSLLRNSELSIANIAEMCGFENQYYFSRLFKKVAGCTPSVFRRK
ncbi:AraC family transcriptional regulator [Tichowtungia aerotolerans]|uniref:Helix-turn-helix domain-containing protein n=1 Tax=Tichowtungia aerotolerans TaxID=2697043 RepID=A0A6P1M7E2_9BACT|nr:AraC family transcriptional regulator [Tichowtungia aerotolerans]QHI69777.1 helix-turn-helix domain-containing protein [Tichowtungia aerotolerans]